MDREAKEQLVWEFMAAAVQDPVRLDAMLTAAPWLLDAPYALHGETPLHYLAVESELEAVRCLLERGADPNRCSELGCWPLLEVVFLANSEMIELLLKYGADPNATDSVHGTALHVAIDREHSPELVAMLLRGGANAQYRTPYGESVFDALPDDEVLASSYLQVLAAHEALEDIDKPGEYGWPPLIRAIQLEERGLARALLSAGASPNVVDDFDGSPLSTAIELNDCEIIVQLLRHGADPNRASGFGNVLHDAMRHGQATTEVLDLLIRGGAALDYRLADGETVFNALPDDFATASSYLGLLAEHGQTRRIDEVAGFATRPLVGAVRHGWVHLVRALLGAGANPRLYLGELREAFEFSTALGETETSREIYSALSDAVGGLTDAEDP